MQEVELNAHLTEIFRDVFSDPRITLKPELTARDIQGWDSFKQIEIILALEEYYDIKFRAWELDELHSVGDLIRIVLHKTNDR